MPQVRKNRFIAAIYSIIVWGLGEVYAGVTNLKIGLGIVFMILWFIYLVSCLILNLNIFLAIAIYSIVAGLLAFDSFRDARTFNMMVSLEEAGRRAPDRCPNCGSKVSKDFRFCPNCGYKLVT